MHQVLDISQPKLMEDSCVLGVTWDLKDTVENLLVNLLHHTIVHGKPHLYRVQRCSRNISLEQIQPSFQSPMTLDQVIIIG